MPAELAMLRRFAGMFKDLNAAACALFIGLSSSAQARWLIKVSMCSPETSSNALRPSRFMPVSTMTSQASPVGRQRAT